LQTDGGPKISIIIPTYNDSDTLPRAITSVLAQSYKNLEIIVVDDASDQEVAPLLSKIYPGEERIKVHRHVSNKMLGAARNSGISIATGDYIFFLDADDKLLPSALAHLLSIAIACNVDVVQGGTLIGGRDDDAKIFHATDFASDGGIDGLELFSEHKFASISWNKLYRREFLSTEGIRFPEKYMHEDVTFAAQTAFLAKGIVSVSDPIIHYTTNANSLTHRTPTRLNIEPYLATYLGLIKVLHDFGVGQDKDRLLILRILRAHGSTDFGRKLIDCYTRMGPELFTEELLSVGWEQSSAQGLAIGDLIAYLLREIPPRGAATKIPEVMQLPWSIMSRLKKLGGTLRLRARIAP
jgi:glycosyltransferase involved in cell wall biosynthesis